MKLSSLQFSLTVMGAPSDKSDVKSFFSRMGWKVKNLEQVDEGIWIADLPIDQYASIEITLVTDEGAEIQFVVEQP